MFVVLHNVMPVVQSQKISQQGPPLLQDAPYLENDVKGIPWNIPYLEAEFYKNEFINSTLALRTM